MRYDNTVYDNTVERIKEHYCLQNYIAKLTGWIKNSGQGYWYTFCPYCQEEETRISKHSFWLNRRVCGCFKIDCKLHGHFDIINLHATLNGLSNREAINQLAKAMPK